MTLVDRGHFELADRDPFLNREVGKLLLAEALEVELSSQRLSKEFSSLLLSPRDTYELHDDFPPASQQNPGSSNGSRQLGPAT
jgi:hypothetical protein